MSVGQVQIRWSGFTGGPGTTTLNFVGGAPDPVDGGAMIDAAEDYAVIVAERMGNQQHLQVQNEVRWFDEGNGTLLDITSSLPAPPDHVGGAGQIGPLPSGACITWNTGALHLGRLVRGRSFCVPLGVLAYEEGGSLSSVTLTNLNNAALALMAAPGATFGVWARPRKDPDTGVVTDPGDILPVVSAHVTDQAAVLRSRRD